jgi:hypothetical protein
MLIGGLPESLIAKTRFVNDRSQKMTLRRVDGLAEHTFDFSPALERVPNGVRLD